MANPIWRVLLVNDDVTELLLMRRAFRDRWPNLRVDAVRIAEQATESLRAFDYALVVANHRLPGASGLDVLETAAQLRPAAQRVLVTATPWHDDVREAVASKKVFEVVEIPLDFRYFTEVAWRGLKRHGLEVAPLPREFLGGKTPEQVDAELAAAAPAAQRSAAEPSAGASVEGTNPRFPVADAGERRSERPSTDLYGLAPSRGDTHVGQAPTGSGPPMAPAAALREAMRQALVTLAETIEASVGSSWGHGSRVAGLACALGAELGLALDELEALEWAALLHDVGEVAVGREVLRAPEALGDSDIAAIYSHANVGWQILRRIPAAHASLLGVRHHHERWDGRGYPDGLRGEEIPLQARIIAVADVFDALATDRPYRRALPLDESVARLREASGTHLDGRLVELFLERQVHLLIDWSAPPTPGPRPW